MLTVLAAASDGSTGTIIAAVIGFLATLVIGYGQMRSSSVAREAKTEAHSAHEVATAIANAPKIDALAATAGVTDELRRQIHDQHAQYVELVRDTGEQLRLSTQALGDCERARTDQDGVIAKLRSDVDRLERTVQLLQLQLAAK